VRDYSRQNGVDRVCETTIRGGRRYGKKLSLHPQANLAKLQGLPRNMRVTNDVLCTLPVTEGAAKPASLISYDGKI